MLRFLEALGAILALLVQSFQKQQRKELRDEVQSESNRIVHDPRSEWLQWTEAGGTLDSSSKTSARDTDVLRE